MKRETVNIGDATITIETMPHGLRAVIDDASPHVDPDVTRKIGEYLNTRIITEVSIGPYDDPGLALARLHEMYCQMYGADVVTDAEAIAEQTGMPFLDALRFLRTRNDAIASMQALGVSIREAVNNIVAASRHIAAMKSAYADARDAEQAEPRNRRERRAAKHSKPMKEYQQWNRQHRGPHSRNRR